MHCAQRLTLRDSRLPSIMPAAKSAGIPPLLAAAAGDLSGRPRCRIFPVGRLWVLQLEIPGGWLLGNGPLEPPIRIRFRTLAAAVNHAVLRGYDYRIVTPGRVARITDRGRKTGEAKRRGVLARRETPTRARSTENGSLSGEARGSRCGAFSRSMRLPFDVKDEPIEGRLR